MINIPDFVYPKDDQGNALCPRCQSIVLKCQCPTLGPVKAKTIKLIPKIRLEKSGRKGKTVTMIEGLPANKEFLGKISKELKKETGSGGTFYIKEGKGIVEIQGDHKEQCYYYLTKI